ncbi:MAG: hypothetical protein OEU48_08900, partial [Gammaproteobacteria bacterium]|nr:hypothetical protein [Gammaproteobacteria bacterium]
MTLSVTTTDLCRQTIGKVFQRPAACAIIATMNLVAFAVVAVVLYLLTSAALTVRLAGPASGLRMSRGTVLLLGLGAVTLHAWVLYPDLVTGQGLNLGFFNAASLIALLTA